MKLTYGYCNALEFLLTHSDNFTKYWTATTPPKTLAVQGEDLSRLLPSVPHEKWILIWKAIEKSGDPVSSSIMVRFYGTSCHLLISAVSKVTFRTEKA